MPTRHARKFARHLALWITRFVGATLTFFGVISMLTPIPFGIIFFIIGLMMLIPTTPSAAKPIQWARGKISLFDKVMTEATRRAPVPVRRVLRMTETPAHLR